MRQLKLTNIMLNRIVKIKIVILAVLLAAPVSATEVFVSHDAEGNVIFSDQPLEGAATHTLKPLPTVPAFKPAPEPEKKAETAPEITTSYTSLGILSPQDQYQLPPGLGGELEISGVLTPKLDASHIIELLDNGQVIERNQQTLFTLRHLSRGEHKLKLRVVNRDKEILIQSNTVTVYVQRYSTLRRGGK